MAWIHSEDEGARREIDSRVSGRTACGGLSSALTRLGSFELRFCAGKTVSYPLKGGQRIISNCLGTGLCIETSL